MKFETFKTLVTKLIDLKERRDNFVDSLPHGAVREAFFDNEFVASLYEEVSLLLPVALSAEVARDVEWLLCEWSVTANNTFWIEADYSLSGNTEEYVINCLGDYFDYAKKYLFDGDDLITRK